MRKLAWAALGFAVAAGLAEYILPLGELPYYAAALAVLSLAGAFVKDRRRRARVLLGCLGAVAGFLGWWGNYQIHVQPSEELVGETLSISATVRDYVEHHADYERVEVRVAEGAPREKALLYLYEGQLPELEPGDVIRAEIRVTSAVIRQGERSRAYTAQGQFLLGYIREGTLTVTGRTPHGWRYFPQRLCHRVEALCDRLFPADVAPFIKGLVTGNTIQLQEDTENYSAMGTAGVRHIVAVSGMHMFVLVGFMQLLLGKSRRTSLACLPVICLFALMAGGKPSVVRAAVMQALVLLAPVLGRESDGVTCLCAALLVLLVPNPMAIGGVGLQLSFACMAGLVFLLPRLLRWMNARLPMEKRAVAYVAGNLACTLSATAFSVPLSALYFGQVPLLSLPANLLTLSVVEGVFILSYAVCALSAVFPAAAAVGAGAAGWGARWCLWVYRTLAGFPLSSLYMKSARTWVWLAGVYAAFTLWYLLRRRGRPAGLYGPVCASLLLLAGVLALGKLSIRRGEGLAAVLDVGQGECVVLADSDGAVVVDCGGTDWNNAGDVAANYLLSIGKARVDMLVLTHLHADHANGVETLLYRMDVGCLAMPAEGDDSDRLRESILAAAERRDVPVALLAEDTRAVAGGVEMDLLLPEDQGDTNERGVVVLAKVGDMRTLVMGDAGREAEMALLKEWAVPDVDMLVVGHHGSNSATGASFLRAAQPETAVISVGYNAYGHPTEAVLERLHTYCDAVLRTDWQGNVVIRSGGKDLGEDG